MLAPPVREPVVSNLLQILFEWSPTTLSIMAGCALKDADDLPKVIVFHDLHLTESLKEARAALKGKSGIYGP